MEGRNRHVQSLNPAELYEVNTILTGFTPGQLTELRNQHFRDSNFLSFIGNLDGWTMEQVCETTDRSRNETVMDEFLF